MPLRPTPDALRERAFAVLAEEIRDAVVLDLFSGTGAVGLEALSRGAARVVFVEHHRAACRLIERNVAQFPEAEGRIRILCRPAVKAVATLSRSRERFTFAWADPPFDAWLEGALALAEAWREDVLDTDAVACLECPPEADLGDFPPTLELRRELAGGASRLLILTQSSAD